MTSVAKQKESEGFAKQFWVDTQKRADAAGMNSLEYLMQVEGGMLKPTIIKMLRHSKAHPDTCPPDCAWQESIKKLKKQFGVE